MATQSVNRSVNIFIEAGDAQKVYDQLIAKEKQLKLELDKATDPAIIKRLTNELKKIEEPLDRASKKLSGELEPSLRDLSGTIKRLERDLRDLSKNDPGYNQKILQLQKAKVAYQEQSRAVNVLAKEQQSFFSSTTNGFKELLTGAGIGVGIASVQALGNALSGFIEGSVEELDAAEQAASKLKNVLNNLGSDAFDRLIQKAGDIAGAFKSIDNDDVVGVFDQLVRYGKLSEEQIGELTPVIIDFAAKTGQSLESSASVIIRSLEGNGKALKEYGINIKDGKNVTERLGIVMTDLKQRVDGAQLAFESTRRGGIANFKQAIADIKEEFGGFLLQLVGFKKNSTETAIAAKKEADSAQALLNEYDALAGKTKLTTEEKIKLKSVQGELVGLFGESVLQVNKETGAYELNRGAVVDLIKQKLLLSNQEASSLALRLDSEKKSNESTQRSKQIATESYLAIAKQAGITNQAILDINSSKSADQYDSSIENLTKKQRAAFNKLRSDVQQYNLDLGVSKDRIEDYAASLKELGFSPDDVSKLLNPNPGKSPINPDGDPDKGVKEKKQLENLYEKYSQIISDGNNELNAINQGQFLKELLANEKKYDALERQFSESLAKKQLTQLQYNKLILDAEDLRSRERILIVQKEEDRIAEVIKAQRERQKNRALQDVAAEAQEKARLMALSMQQQAKMTEDLARQSAVVLNNLEIGLQVDVLKSKGKKKLEAEKELLHLQEEREKAAAIQRGESTALIEEQYRIKRLELETNHWKTIAETIMGFVGSAITAFQAFSDIQNNKENNDLASDERVNERRKKNLEAQLNKGVISRAEYDRKIGELDKQQEAKELVVRRKQFERNKKANLVQAGLNGAGAVLTTLEKFGPPIPPNFLGIAAMAFTGATVLAQLLAISSQKAPEYAKGGVLHGPSHAEGGLPVINPRTGQKVAEMEGGEYILSKKTVANNRSIADALLHNSMHRNGATLQPVWGNQPVQHINYSGITQGMSRMRYFATGGQFPDNSSANNSSQQQNNEMLQMLPAVLNVLGRLSDRLDAGIMAKAVIGLGSIEEQQDRLNNIKNDATAR